MAGHVAADLDRAFLRRRELEVREEAGDRLQPVKRDAGRGAKPLQLLALQIAELMLDPLQSGHDDGFVKLRAEGGAHAMEKAVGQWAEERGAGRASERRMLPRGTMFTVEP